MIYPKETKFHQKHAAFFGRLRGEGRTRLELSYEIVSENLDGSKKVEVHRGIVELGIPGQETGSRTLFLDWARHQNDYFSNILRYYPKETFFQYCLLQSHARYGVVAPTMFVPGPGDAKIEGDLYRVFTGSLALQESLQRQSLRGRSRPGDLNIHISSLRGPELKSLDYRKLLKKKREDGVEPELHSLAAFVPDDQYFLYFDSMKVANDLVEMGSEWGDNLLRLLTLHARHNRLDQKLETQLCLRRTPLTKLFADGVIAEMAMTGSDPFFAEGTDVTVLLRLSKPLIFEGMASAWMEETRKASPGLEERTFNYRGHKVLARYTPDRLVSSFVVRDGDVVIFSNSHRAIRKMVETRIGVFPALSNALDYRYSTTLLPPSKEKGSGYFFASEAFLRRQTSPAMKISEKRRLQCFNNLVMLNNASLFYRLEYGRSPESLSELVDKKFVDASKLVCPHGGVYAFDADRDTGTCSLHNRIRYLTPNAELEVLKVSNDERNEYNRYKERYGTFWKSVFDPIALRIHTEPDLALELLVLPFANGKIYRDLRKALDVRASGFDVSRIAKTAVVSLGMALGRESVARFLRQIPGIPEALEADPTLTDLGWIGDRLAFHFCDGDLILEVDPLQLKTLNLMGETSVGLQAMVATTLLATNLPIYVTIDVEDLEKAERLLEQLASRIFLKKGQFVGLPTGLDAYRLPAYRGTPVYVLSFQLYALKVRLHVALVGEQLVAATKPETLRAAIDAAMTEGAKEPPPAHAQLRFHRHALDRLATSLELYWAEKSRLSCHSNITSIQNLVKLYGIAIEEVDRLSELKYGVRYYCPDGGHYSYDEGRDQVVCSVHGNRQSSRQDPASPAESSFQRFIQSLDEVVATLRFSEESLLATLRVRRPER